MLYSKYEQNIYGEFMANNIANSIERSLPSEADAALAEQSSRTLSAYVSSTQNAAVLVKKGKKQEQVEIPAQALRLLVDILTQMSEGNAITLVPIHHELSTQEAANLLNVSRPYLVGLLEEGKIPFKKVGNKRRMLAQDVLAYKIKIDEARLKTLAKLTEESQKLNMGYDE